MAEIDVDVNDYARPVGYDKPIGPRAVARVLAHDSPLNTSWALPDRPPVPRAEDDD